MVLKVIKQERETSQALIRRFSDGIKRSGILLKARTRRFNQRKKSPSMQKKSALRKVELKKEHEKLRKLGKKIERRSSRRR
ncbi:hypothetical protein ACFLYY_00985 [Patescibacteria group bacterium]